MISASQTQQFEVEYFDSVDSILPTQSYLKDRFEHFAETVGLSFLMSKSVASGLHLLRANVATVDSIEKENHSAIGGAGPTAEAAFLMMLHTIEEQCANGGKLLSVEIEKARHLYAVAGDLATGFHFRRIRSAAPSATRTAGLENNGPNG